MGCQSLTTMTMKMKMGMNARGQRERQGCHDRPATSMENRWRTLTDSAKQGKQD